MQKVVQIGARGEVGARDDLPQEEGAAVGLAVDVEAVQVIAG